MNSDGENDEIELGSMRNFSANLSVVSLDDADRRTDSPEINDSRDSAAQIIPVSHGFISE